MDDLSDYELRVLRQMATGRDEGLVNGAALWAALWAALETLEAGGFIEITRGLGEEAYDITKAGRALVRARALDELMASDPELTEAKNG